MFFFQFVKIDKTSLYSFSKKLTLGLALLCIAAPGFGSTIVAPNSAATIEGNGTNIFPFSFSGSMRYQQVYGYYDFSAFSGPELITQIVFRPDATQGSAFSFTKTDIEIRLSVTTVAPDSLSSTFADNVGDRDTVVYSGDLSVGSAKTGPVGGPMDFDIIIDLQTPFLFDPDEGNNLLLDVRTNGGGSTTPRHFDLQTISGDSVSRAYAFSADATSAVFADTQGLVTQFVSSPADNGVDQVAIDIKFCSDPNAFNCKENGVLPLTIFGTDSLDVADIDPATLQLCLADLSACTSGPRNWDYDDRGDAGSDLGAGMCAVNGDTGEEEDFLTRDDHFDMDVAFEAKEVQAMLEIFCGMDKGAVSETLVVIGSTFDGSPFSSTPIGDTGIDQLVKVNKLKEKKAKNNGNIEKSKQH